MTAEERPASRHRRAAAVAVRRARRDGRLELVAEALGEHIFEWFLRNKRAEWNDYKAQVTPFELARYLPTW